MIRFYFYIPLFLLIHVKGFTQPGLPSLLSDNMVLQQNTKVVLWGWAKPGISIELRTSWDNKTYTAKANTTGRWEVTSATPTAGGPYRIFIHDNKTDTIKNVMIGEVWLCAGQSNMEMPMKGFLGEPVLGSNEDILKSANKNIRFISVPRNGSTIPLHDFDGNWQIATPETVSGFSATAYYFGRLLNEMLDVPVGLIDVSFGGSCIQTWMSKNTAVPFENTPIPGPNDTIKVRNRTPTTLFNGMMNPVIGYGIKGSIWYQGETNFKEPELYKSIFPAMVKEYRELWGQGDFPFYYVQIAPFNYGQWVPDSLQEKLNSAYFREAQYQCLGSIPNSGMAVIMDLGEFQSIHPARKKETGHRLAYWALAKTYEIEGFGYRGPEYKAIEIKDSTVIVSFNHVENGLTSFGKELQHFEIAGEDKVFYPAKAMLRRKSVIVYSDKVINPVAVRYAFKDFVTGDLFGTDGLPVSSFRSDNW